jgi:protein-tyrosine phosphatase
VAVEHATDRWRLSTPACPCGNHSLATLAHRHRSRPVTVRGTRSGRRAGCRESKAAIPARWTESPSCCAVDRRRCVAFHQPSWFDLCDERHTARRRDSRRSATRGILGLPSRRPAGFVIDRRWRRSFHQSCVVRPLALPRIVETYHLKTVLDLRNDPDKQTSVEREREVLTALGVRHVHVPMDPDPTLDEIDEAAKVLLDEDNWPILVHCHHGEGRSVMMAAIFRVLYQDKSVDEALRLSARLPEGLMFVENFARTGITPDNFKADRMREYLEQHAR